MVLIGAGRSFIAGADIRQFGKPRPTLPRNSQDVLDQSAQAGRGGDPRVRAGRRARARARQPLPRRGAERESRPARSADRHPAGRRRHAAPAAADRPQGGDGHDRERAARARGRGEDARHRRRDRGRKGPARRGHPLREEHRRQAPAAARARQDRPAGGGESRSGHVRGHAQVDRAQGAQPEGALPLHRVRGSGGHAAVR